MLGESGMHAAGFLPDKFKTMNVRKYFSSQSANDLTVHWNVQIHLFLKYYVMLRLMDRKKARGLSQMGPVLATFAVSSMWHGTYPGYAILFSAFFVSDVIYKGLPKYQFVQVSWSKFPKVA